MVITRRHKMVIGTIAVLVAGGIYAILENGFAAEEALDRFGSARAQGAVVADAIVGLSGRFGSDLQDINRLDREREYSEALKRTEDLLARSEEMRAKARELSSNLQTMTETLQAVEPLEARMAALDSIAKRIILIDHLIRYSENLRELAEVLRAKFSGIAISDTNVQILVDKVNIEVSAINNLNRNAMVSMERFDELVKSR